MKTRNTKGTKNEIKRKTCKLILTKKTKKEEETRKGMTRLVATADGRVIATTERTTVNKDEKETVVKQEDKSGSRGKHNVLTTKFQ